jgi:hypothetical protein
MSRFDPNRDIKIDVKETQTGLHLRTAGLTRFGTSELEMIDVEPEDMREAGGVLNTLAESIVNQNRKVKANERIAIRAPSGALVARFAEGTSVAATGFMARLMGQSESTLRVEEPVEGMGMGLTLFSTVRLWRAAKHLEDGDEGAAKAVLLGSIARFPGDPERSGEVTMGFPYNAENHLSYAMLAQLEPHLEKRATWLEQALARSDEYLRAELGDDAEELRGAGRPFLAARVLVLASENATPAQEARAMGGMTICASPTRTLTERGDRQLAQRSLTLLPSLMAQYQPARDVANEAWREAVLDVLWAHLDAPGFLLALTGDVRDLYEGDRDEAPSVEGAADYEIGDRLLSLLLADARRCEYAGLSPDDFRARGGASKTPLSGAAERKLDALIARETEAYVSAVSNGPF